MNELKDSKILKRIFAPYEAHKVIILNVKTSMSTGLTPKSESDLVVEPDTENDSSMLFPFLDLKHRCCNLQIRWRLQFSPEM